MIILELQKEICNATSTSVLLQGEIDPNGVFKGRVIGSEQEAYKAIEYIAIKRGEGFDAVFRAASPTTVSCSLEFDTSIFSGSKQSSAGCLVYFIPGIIVLLSNF